MPPVHERTNCLELLSARNLWQACAPLISCGGTICNLPKLELDRSDALRCDPSFDGHRCTFGHIGLVSVAEEEVTVDADGGREKIHLYNLTGLWLKYCSL